jgi:hypothetical protein
MKEKRGPHRFGEYIRSQKLNRIAGDQEERERERGREREREMSLVHNVQELGKSYQDTQHLMCLS